MGADTESDTGALQASAVEGGKLRPSQDLFCGALAGCSARMVVAPLDVLKIRFQVQSETRGLYRYASMGSALRSIIAHEGLHALWKGNIPALLMVTPYASLQLAAFYQLRQSNIVEVREPYASLMMGAISGAFATVCTYPLDLLRTRFAAQGEPKLYSNIRHAVDVIYTGKGLRGFYAGLQPTLIEIVPYISLQFTLYEGLKGEFMKGSNVDHLKPRESLFVGAMSGTISKFLTLPLDNAKKLMQVEGQFQAVGHGSSQYRGMGHVLQTVWRRDGIRGWFRGTLPSLVKAAPNSAITFAAYEAAKRYFAASG